MFSFTPLALCVPLVPLSLDPSALSISFSALAPLTLPPYCLSPRSVGLIGVDPLSVGHISLAPHIGIGFAPSSALGAPLPHPLPGLVLSLGPLSLDPLSLSSLALSTLALSHYS